MRCSVCFDLMPCRRHYPRKPFAGAKRSSSLYQTYRWKQERKQHLAIEPYCRDCGKEATFVDHIVPHRGDDVMFWNTNNWKSLCRPCSNAKSAREAASYRGGGV